MVRVWRLATGGTVRLMSLWTLRRATIALVALLIVGLVVQLPNVVLGVLVFLLVGFSVAYNTRRRDYLRTRAEDYH